MHGGALRTGAPVGSRNALKNGLYTRAAIKTRRALKALLREARQTLEEIS